MPSKDQKASDKRKDSKSIQQDVAQHAEGTTLQLEDNRQESAVQLKWSDHLKNNSSVSFTDNRASSRQWHELANSGSSTQPVQMIETGQDEQREKREVPQGLLYTAQLASNSDASSATTEQPKSTQSGLPAKLQSGVESLSGQSMSDVTVHKNSSKPTQLNAHAYAQGSDIHVAPGQEKHLPHEAWHVAQQKQGRVKPTKQLKGKTNINDDEGLEHEADVMGAKAAQFDDEVMQPKPIGSSSGFSLIQFNTADAGKDPALVAGGSYSFTEPGFVFEKSQMRSLSAVAQIKQGPGNDATKADLVKNSKQKIGNELDPKTLGFLIPVNMDISPSNQVGTWTPIEVNTQYDKLVDLEKGKLEAAASVKQGYLDADKIIRSKSNLLKKDGLKVVDDKNEASKKPGAKSGGSFRKIFSGDWEESEKRHERDKINSNEIARPEALKAGIESVKSSAAKEVPALSKVALAENPQGTKVTPLGTFITLVGKNSFGLGKEFEFTSTFKLNSHTDYSADYLGTSVKVPSIQIGDPQKAELKVDIGEFTHEASDKGSVLSSNQGSASLTVLGQEATATWNSIELDTSKSTDALKVKWGSVEMSLDMMDTKMNFTIKGPDLDNGVFTFSEASGTIAKLSPFDGLNFKNVNAEITSAGGAYDMHGEADLEAQNLPGIESASGKIAITRASNGTMQYTLQQGSLTAKILEQTIAVNGLSYDSAKDPSRLSADEASVNLDLEIPTGGKVTGTAKVLKPSISSSGFTYEGASIDFPVVSPIAGIEFTEVKGTLQSDTNTLEGSANFKVGSPSIGNGSGSIQINKKGSEAAHYTMNNGNFDATIVGQTVGVNGVKYDSAKAPSFVTAAEASLGLDLDIPTGGEVKGIGKVLKPSLSDSGFTYGGASIDFSVIKLFNGVEFTDVKGEVQSDAKTFNGSANFNVASDTLGEASGTIKISKVGSERAHYDLSGGAFKSNVLGQKVAVTGVNYNSDNPKEITASSVTINFEILDRAISFEVAQPKLNESGFDFATIKTKIPELGFAGAKLSNMEVTLKKEGGAYSLMGMTNFDVAGNIGGATLEQAKGKVIVSRNAGDANTQIALEEGQVDLKISKSTISLSALNYANEVLTAGKATLAIEPTAMMDAPLAGTMENLKIANGDFSFTKASMTNLPEIDAGIIAVAPSEIIFNKENQNYSILATGSITLKAFGGGNEPLLSGTGSIGYDFATEKASYEISEASAKITNPLAAYRIPESIPGIPWPVDIDTPIPIIPGVSVNIGAHFGGGIGFKEDINLSLSKSGEALRIAATTGVNGSLSMTVSVGVLAGVPLLANVEAGLEAGGEFAAQADITLANTFNLGKGNAPSDGDTLTPANDKVVTITGDGEISLLAKVFLKAQALVFIKKKVEKVLGKTVLGSFSFNSNESPKFKFNSRKEAIQSKEEMESLNQTMLPKSFQGMSGEEVKRKLEALRNDDNKLTDQAVTEFVERFKVSDDAAATDVFDRLNTLGYINYHNIQWSKLSALTKDNESSDKFKANIKLVGESILSKEAFLTEYDHLITKAKGFTEYAETAKLVAKHEQLLTFYNDLNVLKRKAHSQKFGDNFRQTITVLTGRFTRTKSQLGAVYAQLDESRKLYPQVVELERTLMEKLDPPPVTSLPVEEPATA